MPPPSPAVLEHAVPDTALRRLVLLAAGTIATVVGGLVVWGLWAQLETATIAPGSVMVESRRKTVSSADGGSLQALLVKEGDRVKAGQPLLRLNTTQAEADFNEAMVQYWGLRASIARLTAERDNHRTIDFPPELESVSVDNPTVASLLDSERTLFEARWRYYDAAIGMQDKVIEELRHQVAAIDAERSALEARQRFSVDQLNDMRTLFSRGYQTKPNLVALEKEVIDNQGQIRQRQAMKGSTEQQIAGAEMDKMKTATARLSDAAKQLDDALAQAAAAKQRMISAQDVLNRREILSPDDGIVTDIRFFTRGSSIGAGQPIMDIVPQNGALLVQAQVKPTDVERVRRWMDAQIQLLAYPTSLVPLIPAKVEYVGADQQVDAQGNPFFQIRVVPDTAFLAGLKTITLSPGMPASVYVIHEKRAALDYLIAPLTSTFRRAFREQ